MRVDLAYSILSLKYLTIGRPYITRNTCTQQPLAHPSNISLENPSNNDNFSKFSKRQILLTITGRGHVKKESTQNLAANKQQSKLEIILYLNCL